MKVSSKKDATSKLQEAKKLKQEAVQKVEDQEVVVFIKRSVLRGGNAIASKLQGPVIRQ